MSINEIIQTSDITPTNKNKCSNFDNTCKKALVESMLNEVKRHGTTPGCFSSVSWNRIIASFTEAKPYYKNIITKLQLQSQQSAIKKKYVIFSALKQNSGFGWNDALKMPTAPDSVWDAYIASHPNAKEFRFNTLYLYEFLTQAYKLLKVKYKDVLNVVSYKNITL